MLSVLIQLIGSFLLSFNAITKSINSRALEGQLIIPNSKQLELKDAIQIQKRYFLNVLGFVILFVGYFLQLIKVDFLIFDFEEGYFCALTTFSLSIMTILIIFLLITYLSKRTASKLIELSKSGVPGKTFLYVNPDGRGYNE